MAEGLFWHLGAGLFCIWLAYLFVKRGQRLAELEGGFVALVAFDGPPPRPLVLRALRFLEGECADVMRTRVRLEQPEPGDAVRAVSALLGRLNAARRADAKQGAGEVFAGASPQTRTHTGNEGEPVKARWNGTRWELS